MRPKLSYRNQNYFTIHGPAVDIGRTPALRHGYDNLETMAGSQHTSAKTPLPNLAAAMPSRDRAGGSRVPFIKQQQQQQQQQLMLPEVPRFFSFTAKPTPLLLLSPRNNATLSCRQASYLRLAKEEGRGHYLACEALQQGMAEDNYLRDG
jgi:hypothetical protein